MLSNTLSLPADGHEYLNVAWNLAHGYGFRKTIKWNFYTPEPVVHSALSDRPIFYSVVLTPIAAWVSPRWLPLALQLYSLLFTTAAVALAYLLWRRLYGETAALAGGLILCLQPGLVDIGAQPLTEPLLLLLLMGALTFAARARTPLGWGASGFMVGLAYLTRPNGLFLLPALAAYPLLSRREAEDVSPNASSKANRRARWRGFAGLMAGFLLAAVPFWIANARANGNPFASDLKLAYAVLDVSDATWNGYGHGYTTPLHFVLAHPKAVFWLTYRQFWSMFSTFFNSLPFLIAFLLFVRRKNLRGLSGALFGFSLVTLVFYALSWTVRGAVRYLLPATLCMAGPLLDAFVSLPLPPLSLGRRLLSPTALLLAAMAFWYSPWLYRLYSTSASRRSHGAVAAMYPVGCDWLKRQAPAPDAVVVSNNPWMVDYYTHQPAVVCPFFTTTDQVRNFIGEYHVRYIVLFGNTNVEGREKSIRNAHLPGRFVLLPHNVRAWDLGNGFTPTAKEQESGVRNPFRAALIYRINDRSLRDGLNPAAMSAFYSHWV